MPMFDAFRHPVLRPDEASLFDLSDVDWSAWCDQLLSESDRAAVASSGICLMDPAVITNAGFQSTASKLQQSNRAWFTLQPDLNAATPHQQLRAAKDAGIRGITFHSYLQHISDDRFPLVVELSQLAEELGMFVGLCTAYGSRQIYRYDNLRLTVEVLNAVKCPVVMYHAGGAKVLDAMLIAEMWDNAYLETSFSLSYWLGSSVENDLAFVIRKLGSERILFGSDAPFIPLDQSIEDHQQFLRRHQFNQTDSDNIMGRSCRRLLSEYQ